MIEDLLIPTAIVAALAVIAVFFYVRKQDAKIERDNNPPLLKRIATYDEWEGPEAYHEAVAVGFIPYRRSDARYFYSAGVLAGLRQIAEEVFAEGYEPEVTDDWTKGRDCENQAIEVIERAVKRLAIPRDAFALVTCQNMRTGGYHVFGCLRCYEGDLGFDNDGSVSPFHNYFSSYTDIRIEGVNGLWHLVHRI